MASSRSSGQPTLITTQPTRRVRVRTLKCLAIALISIGFLVPAGRLAWLVWRRGDAPQVSVSLRPKLVVLPAGQFTMGSPPGEAGRYDDEAQVERTVNPFAIAQTEVTQGQWRALMGNNPSKFQACGDECPVEQVSWFDAVAYCNRLSKTEGLPECYQMEGCSGVPGTKRYECTSVALNDGLKCRGYRLPTEPEWEYAARAGDRRATYNGELTLVGEHNAPQLDAIAWYGGNSKARYDGADDCSGWDEKQHPSDRCGPQGVGLKRANAWGLHDMLGNVEEWTQGQREAGERPKSDEGLDLSADVSRGRVSRGCGWSFGARACRAADRFGNPPGYRYGDLGFRPARSWFP